jgi:5'(3')-deoxyribonucleotidase
MHGKPTVYIDMDGVLADFFGGVEKLYGVSHWKELTSDKTKDLKQEVINKITGTDFFATLPKFESADALIDMVKEYTGGKFSINTSPLRGDNENSGKYKKVWISNNIEQPDEIIVTGRKETFAKDKASGTPNILIDDRPVNIERWRNAGGYGILYQANRDPLTKVKKGLEDYAKIRRD